MKRDWQGLHHPDAEPKSATVVAETGEVEQSRAPRWLEGESIFGET